MFAGESLNIMKQNKSKLLVQAISKFFFWIAVDSNAFVCPCGGVALLECLVVSLRFVCPNFDSWHRNVYFFSQTSRKKIEHKGTRKGAKNGGRNVGIVVCGSFYFVGI